MPKVALISNVFHYYYTALSLYRCGYLERYITCPSARDDEVWLRRLGGAFERLWLERRLEGIPPDAVRRLWLPEIARKALPRLGGSPEFTNRVANALFAKHAARMMPECDAVHFVNSVGWEAARRANRSGMKIICDMREEHPRFQAHILAEEAKALGIEFTVAGSSYTDRVFEEIGLSDFIFCPTSYAKRTFVEQGVSADKVVVCPYGVDSEQFVAGDRARKEKGDGFTILFLGQVCMRKGIHYLLEGFRKARLSGARLILAGPVDPTFRAVLDRFRGSFEEAGRVPRSQVPRHYLNADVFVMPSLADSYGLAVLEAMSAALPVIVSDNTGAADHIADGREGFVVPIKNSDKIAEKLTFLYENREQCTVMGMAAKQTARSLDWNNYQRVCADFYRSKFGS